jgi:hypothetical protein
MDPETAGSEGNNRLLLLQLYRVGDIGDVKVVERFASAAGPGGEWGFQCQIQVRVPRTAIGCSSRKGGYGHPGPIDHRS